MTREAGQPASSRQATSKVEQRVVALAGGRGGVGRSVLTANLGVYLAQVGKRVVLIDADLGGASLHTLLGLDRPKSSLTQVIDRQAEHLKDLVIDTPIPNLRLLPGAGDRFGVANLRPTQKERLIQQLRGIDADFVFLDVGAGTSFNVLDIYLAADYGVLVVVPEPTSVEATYRFLKNTVIRLVRREVGRQTQWPQVLDDAIARLGGLPDPLELEGVLKESSQHLADLVDAARHRLRARLVVNRVKARSDLELGASIRTLAANHLGINLSFLGSIENDDAVWLAARKRRPLLIESPECQAATDIERIARRILASIGHERAPSLSSPSRPTGAQSHYEILEVDIGASDDEIRRGTKRMREIYGEDSLAAYSLIGLQTMATMQERIQVAHDVLLDPRSRRPYDISLPQGDAATPVSGEAVGALAPAAPPTPPPFQLPDIDLTPETEFTGAMLRRIRQARGVDLRDITARTKIGMAYLHAIEEEDFDALPAMVYTKGFLGEMAKFLELDPRQVVNTYVRRFRKHLEESGKPE
jgi:flagellar biosynthesis protein FlhG